MRVVVSGWDYHQKFYVPTHTTSNIDIISQKTVISQHTHRGRLSDFFSDNINKQRIYLLQPKTSLDITGPAMTSRTMSACCHCIPHCHRHSALQSPWQFLYFIFLFLLSNEVLDFQLSECHWLSVSSCHSWAPWWFYWRQYFSRLRSPRPQFAVFVSHTSTPPSSVVNHYYCRGKNSEQETEEEED